MEAADGISNVGAIAFMDVGEAASRSSLAGLSESPENPQPA